ncbi:MAG: HlyD family efflux transporter periplasmic adaptor subunit [Candidatus Aminicenantes bacterium]|nr:HlyD family efflux transporter periplasmic adaptor subunit [Candidatus Aminicenantes bacterium]NIM83415.1 HlyD family efflux transporter periplasmic adaptor subunit [Candidatus Aminicenantes bacterium]NIN24686.1 HlyD family efflux transporter periplasmic adaptor subunit [Candidatus Aminicenantes bacterium]NIN48447.1 HlyD family efflux transporter periplasmic adaptor subunit [Candidatus Aminicenantes bacterium]NIN91344.1 HlyD family efflux transporter periplasmic adaptor subunit [Candidatus A
MKGLATKDTKNTKEVRFFIFFSVLVMFLVMVSCSEGDKGVIKAPGIVDGDIITLKSTVAGTIQQMDISEGEKVVKGKQLVQVDVDKIENQLKELEITGKEIEVNSQKISKKLGFLESNIRYLRKQVERFRRLKKKNAVPGEKLEAMELKLMEAETSQFDLKKALEGLEIQKEKIENKREYLHLLLEDHVLLSPVDGVVMEKFVSAGETVFPGTAIVDILDTSSLYVEIFIEEKEMGRLKLNQQTKIRVDGADKELTGVISLFGKKAEFSPKYIISEKERKSLLYQVKITVQDPEGILKIGMPVTVTFGVME